MRNKQSETGLPRHIAIGLFAVVFCVAVAVSVGIQRRPVPPVVRLIGVEAAPSLEQWLSVASPAGYSNCCDAEQDVVGSWPDDHRGVVVRASIPLRRMRRSAGPTACQLQARDLALSARSGGTCDGAVLLVGSGRLTLLPWLYTLNRRSLLRPWPHEKRFLAQVAFAVPVSQIPERFTLSYRGEDVASFELEQHHGAVGVDAVGLE